MITWEQTELILEFLFNICLIAIPVLITLSGGALAAGSTVKSFRWAVKAFRPAVDETTDTLTLFLAARTGRSPQWISTYFTTHIDSILGVLPETVATEAHKK